MPQGAARVAVIGAGHVGVTTAVVLAHLDHVVRCSDVDPEKVQLLSAGIPTIFEENLEHLLREGLDSSRLSFTTNSTEAVSDAEFVFLCVPTPQYEDGSADVRALCEVAHEIGPQLAPNAVVVNKSTVPVGSASLIERLLRRPDVVVVSNPEFLREGTAIEDCLHPERIVVGSDDQLAAGRVADLFAKLDSPVIITDAASSETIKYAANAFLATKLSFVNAVATLCEHLGASVSDVLRGLGYDHRIGFDYLQPGPGWGGSCLPKDTRALLYLANRAGYEFPLLREVIETNEAQLQSVVEKVLRSAGEEPSTTTVAVWGLSFKAGTDDVRSSPSVEVARRLLRAGAKVRAYDPSVRGPLTDLLEDVEIGDDPYLVCEGASVLAVLTDWDVLTKVDMRRIHDVMARPRIVDARNLLDAAAMRDMGFNYVGMGNP